MEDNKPKTVTLEMDVAVINLILEGLAQLPMARSHDLYYAIKAQAQQQLEDKKPQE